MSAKQPPKAYIRYPIRDSSDEEDDEGSASIYKPGYLFVRRKQQRNNNTTATATTTAAGTATVNASTAVAVSIVDTANFASTSTRATATKRTPTAAVNHNLPTSGSWCKCGNCSEMPEGVERKCCLGETFDYTNFQDPNFRPGEQCVLESNFVFNTVLQKGHLELAWVAQRRFLGLRDPEDIDVKLMTNTNYRFCAYRSYINFIYGFLGRRNRRVIPACVVGHIRNTWPDPHGSYVGYKDPEHDDDEQDNQYIPADELQAMADGTEI